MTVTIRPAEKNDVREHAALIEAIERFYGTTDADIKPFDERLAQVEEALFGSPPLASALVVEDGTGGILGLAAYSFLWPSAAPPTPSSSRSCTSVTPCVGRASGPG